MKLELIDLEKHFGTVKAVRKVSFHAGPGDIIGLLGPNGAGKSTIIKTLVGLVKPTSGKILCEGVPIDSDPIFFKSRIGYIPEEQLLYPYLNSLEFLQLIGNLKGLDPSVVNTRIEKLLRLFSLYPARHRPIAVFSKGMKQKVLLCGALIHNPDILVLDEPLNGLDVAAVLILYQVIQKLASSGKTIIYSSHILETVEKLCTRVVIIHKGALIADTIVEDLQNLKENPSLEEVFSRLVLDQDPNLIAEQIVGVMAE